MDRSRAPSNGSSRRVILHHKMARRPVCFGEVADPDTTPVVNAVTAGDDPRAPGPPVGAARIFGPTCVVVIVALMAAAALRAADEVRPSEARAGAHWAFRPLGRPAVPAVRNADWVRNPVDAFVLARLESEGMTPAAEADRRTLLRRVTFNLTGLPPTPEEVDA